MKNTFIILAISLFMALTSAVKAQTTPDCKAPDALTVSNLTSSGATISWGLTAGYDNPSIYALTIKDQSHNIIYQDNALSAPNLTHTITGLSANTTYTVELTGNCNASSSGYSTTATVTFTTMCATQSAPYVQNFDTLTAMPPCSYSSNVTLSYISRSGKALNLHSTTSTGAYIVFPELSLNSNLVECSLWMKSSLRSNLNVQIGLVSDPANIGDSFEPLYTTTLNSTNWTEIQMNTALTQEPVRSTSIIAINLPSGFNADIYIDDLSIHQVPTCSRPEDFTVSNITASSATLSWTTTNATQAKIYINGSSEILATTNPFTLSNLIPDTDYSLTLRGICSPTDSSELCRTTLNFHTKCALAVTPLFTESFDTLSTPDAVPQCWEQGFIYRTNDNTLDAPFTTSTAQVHSGTRAMSLKDQPTGSIGYLSSQLLPIDSADKYTLSVWIYRQNASDAQYQSLRFWATPNLNDTIGGTFLGAIPLHFAAYPAEPTANIWYNYEYVIPTSGNLYIMVEGISEENHTMYFDDINLILTPSCMKVSHIALGTPTSNSVPLTWQPGKNESQWAVSYTLTQNSQIVRTVTDTTTTPTLNITGLSDATVYSLQGSITSLCSSVETRPATSPATSPAPSLTFAFTFTTSCLPLSTIPYTCGFESSELANTSNPLPLCWSRLNNGRSSTNYYPKASSSASKARTASGYLQFYPSSSVLYNYGDYQVAILPELASPLNLSDLRLLFYTRMDDPSTAHNLTIGVLSNPSDISTFTPLDSFTVSGDTYRRHETLFDQYTGSGRYPAIMCRRALQGSPIILLDDLTLDTIPACRDLSGTGITISDITNSSARINLSDTTATTWQYAYGIAGTPAASLTPATPSGSSTIISSLLPATSYSVYARRLCGTNYGNWCEAVNFTTACTPATLPYTDDFESRTTGYLADCYTTSTTDVDRLSVFSTSTGAAANATYNHTSNGSKGISTSRDAACHVSTSSTLTSLIYAHLEAGKNYEISLYAKRYIDNNNDYSYRLTFLMGTLTSYLNSVGSFIINNTAFDRFAANFSVSTTGDYYIGFRTSLSPSASNYYPYLDDLSIQEISCTSPSAVLVTDLTSSSAVLNINSTASQWEVAVSSFPIDVNGSIDADVFSDTLSTTTVTIPNLRTNADYYYTVRTLCANGDASAWLASSSFHTACTSAEIPYSEGFENTRSTDCWTNMGVSGNISRSTSQKHSGEASMLAKGSIISPQFNIITFAPYELNGWLYAARANSTLSIGVMTDPDDAATYEIISQIAIPQAGKWLEFSALFDSLNDPEYQEFYNARYLVLSSGTDTIYLDDLEIDLAPSCKRPSNVTISSVGASSAVIDWTDRSTASSWTLRIVPAGGSPDTITVTSHPYTISNLNASTTYNIYLSANCSPTDASPEVSAPMFNTSCGVIRAPYSEDFELQTISQQAACWSISWNAPSTASPTSSPRVWAAYESGGNRSLRLWNWGVAAGNSLTNSPEIAIPATGNYELYFEYCHQATSGPLYAKIRRRGESTFTPLDTLTNQGLSTTEDYTPLKFTPLKFTPVICPLTAYAGDTITLQFLNVTDNVEGALWIDNVKIREHNPCSSPDNIRLISLTDSTARIVITDTLHTQWQYQVSTGIESVATVSQGSQTSLVTSSTDTLSLTGLTPSTAYTLSLRAICGTNSYSDWLTLNFQTTDSPTPLPYSTTFANAADNDLWSHHGSADNSFTFGVDANAQINSTHAMYVSPDGHTYRYDNTKQAMSAVARLFDFSNTDYNIEFDWQCTGGQDVRGRADYCRFYLVPAYSSILPSGQGSYYEYYFWPDGMIPLDDDTMHHEEYGTHHVSATLNMRGKAGCYYLVFYWFNLDLEGNENYPLSVANLNVSEVTCPPVSNLTILPNSITQTSITALCTNQANTLRWAVSTTQMLQDTIESVATVSHGNTDTLTINNLSPSTQYYLMVRSECDSTNASPWVTLPFTTSCGAITNFPYTQDFENTLFPPLCWSADGWSRYANFPYQYAHGNGCAHVSSYQGGTLVSPEILLESDREYYISFWMVRMTHQYYTDQMKVYISPSTSLTDATLLATYTAYDASTSTDEMKFYSFDLPQGLSGTHYIIFEGVTQTSYLPIYLDDITIDRYSLCREPESAPSLVASTASTITVTADPMNYTSIQYGIAPYSTSVTPASIIAVETRPATSPATPAQFTGLTPSTRYAIYSRGICDFCNDTTDWSPALTATTKFSDCFAPDGLTITSFNDTSATIVWNVVPDVTTYECILSSSNGSDTITTSALQLTYIALMSETSYTFSIRGFCNSIDTTDWSSISFTTLTTPATIPYITGFEPTDDNSLWRKTLSAFTNFVIGTDGGGRHSGTQGLYMSTNGNTYSQTYPTAPGYNNVYGSAYISRTLYFHEAGNYEVSFDWKSDPISSNTYGYFEAYGRAYIVPVQTSLPIDSRTYATAYPANSIELVSQLTGSQTWQRSSFVIEVPEAGYRDLVFQWYSFNKYGSADASDLSDYPLAIDNLDVERVYCLTINGMTPIDVSDTFATIAINKSAAVTLEYALTTVNDPDSIVSVATVTPLSQTPEASLSASSAALRDTIFLTGLSPLTTYYLFVRQVCDSTHSSSWRSISFSTTNPPAPLPYICDFEQTSENALWQFSQNQTNQFVIGNHTSASGVKSLYISDDGVSNNYNNTATSYAYAYRTLHLAAGSYQCSYDWRNVGESIHDYARVFLYPADRTFPLGSNLADLWYNNTPYAAIALDGDYQLVGEPSFTTRECVFDIATTGSYNVVISWENDAMDGTNPPFALDNLSIKELTCLAPTVSVVNDLQQEGVTSLIITNNQPGSDIVYIISTQPVETRPATSPGTYVDTLHYTGGIDTIPLTTLSATTLYYASARSLCDSTDHSIWSSTSFTTPCGLITSYPYAESFESIPTTYTRGMIGDICWSALNASSSASAYPRYVANTTSTNVTDGSRSLQLYAHKTTPLILVLPELYDVTQLTMSFDVKFDLTKSTAQLYAGYLTDPTDASTFVALSTPALSKSFAHYSLSYAGVPDTARLAFKYVGGSTNGRNCWLDNIEVLHIINGGTFYDTLCYEEDYTLHGFNIPADSIAIGASTIVQTRPATSPGISAPDTIVTAHLYRRAQSLSTTYDTICAGQPYTVGIWNIPNPISRRYHQTFPNASYTGCDSTAELYLTVIPSSTLLYDTICEGQSYTFRDTTLTTAGIYTRSYIGQHGCPSIDTLYLMVIPDSIHSVATVCQSDLPFVWRGQSYTATGRYTQSLTGPHGCPQTAVLYLTVHLSDSIINANMCQGGYVQVADTVITQSGSYLLSRINSSGCYVTYHITVTEVPLTPEDVYDVACEGYLYYGHGISGLNVTQDTVVTITTRTLDARCDSIAYVHISYHHTQYGDTSATMPQGGSFTWRNNTYTTPGDYTATLADHYGCDSVVTLHLSYGTGIDDVETHCRASQLKIVPNPVTAGETVFIYTNVEDVTQVELLNSYGQVIEIFSPTTSPIEIKGITAAGLYYIRLTSQDGTIHLQKLIVK